MAQQPRSTAQPKPPLVDDIGVKDAFADDCAGASFVNGNIHLTFTSITADHTRDPAPSKRVVSARLVITPTAMMELADILGRLTAMLKSQGMIVQTQNQKA